MWGDTLASLSSAEVRMHTLAADLFGQILNKLVAVIICVQRSNACSVFCIKAHQSLHGSALAMPAAREVPECGFLAQSCQVKCNLHGIGHDVGLHPRAHSRMLCGGLFSAAEAC